MAQTRRLVSITPIEAQPIPNPPNLQFNDRRKYCISCSQLATNQVAFRQYDMIIIERYCSACMSNLNLNSGLKKRKREIMSDIIYRCNKCGLEFASLDTLVEHKITCGVNE